MELKYLDKKRYLLENYCKIGLNEQQLIIILLCIDDTVFKVNYDLILESMNLDVSEVTKLLSELLNKNLIEISLQKQGDSYIEIVDGAKLFSSSTSIDSKNIFSKIELAFGKTLSNTDVNTISKWISVNKYDVNDIISAFETANLNNVYSLKYVEKILENNLVNNEEEVTPFKFEYDWIKDE